MKNEPKNLESDDLIIEISNIHEKIITLYGDIISVLNITGRFLYGESRTMIFSLYENNLKLYKIINVLLQINRETKEFYHDRLFSFKYKALESLKALRKIIGFLKLSGNILSDNYIEDIVKWKSFWLVGTYSYYIAISEKEQNIEEIENAYTNEQDFSNYVFGYGKIEYEDEYTQPIV